MATLPMENLVLMTMQAFLGRLEFPLVEDRTQAFQLMYQLCHSLLASFKTEIFRIFTMN